LASASGSIRLVGAKELQAALDALEKKTVTKFSRTAVREGAKVVQRAAKAKAPKRSGKLRRSIRVRAKKNKKKGEVAFLVTSGAGDNVFKGETWYGAAVEFGHKVGKRPSGVRGAISKFLGDNRKQVPPHPFLAPAFQAAADAAASAITAKLWELIKAEAEGAKKAP
jgi:HK97 gp10 family phage protein